MFGYVEIKEAGTSDFGFRNQFIINFDKVFDIFSNFPGGFFKGGCQLHGEICGQITKLFLLWFFQLYFYSRDMISVNKSF